MPVNSGQWIRRRWESASSYRSLVLVALGLIAAVLVLLALQHAREPRSGRLRLHEPGSRVARAGLAGPVCAASPHGDDARTTAAARGGASPAGGGTRPRGSRPCIRG